MIRRGVLMAFLSCLGIGAQKKPTLKKFYITTGRYACHIPPFESWGVDSLDALTRIGITVWTEEEWRENGKSADWFRQSEACRSAGTLQDAIKQSAIQDQARAPK